ncbi:MAG: GtrA family protein [Propionibacteriaceae bacterium]|jgi:putative flippase GtrA|nr:GtrA family protein [Propionibacteriaceae bacterium]
MIRSFMSQHWGSFGQLFRFCIVGASGVLVNMIVALTAKKVAPLIWEHAQVEEVFLPIPGTPYNIRWFLVFSVIAFVVANLWNYQLNRTWSFKSDRHAGWLREFFPFFTVGLIAQGLGMVVELALMHPYSAIELPSSIFDNSTGFRTKWYWAHLIMISVTIPISFLLNKFWTFRSIRNSPKVITREEG